jgi:hypothetical protein
MTGACTLEFTRLPVTVCNLDIECDHASAARGKPRRIGCQRQFPVLTTRSIKVESPDCGSAQKSRVFLSARDSPDLTLRCQTVLEL